MTKKPNKQYNTELILVHQHLKTQYTQYLESNRIKNEKERLQWAHAVQTIGYIAHNCNITSKTTPQDHKRETIQKNKEKERPKTVTGHTDLFNMATTD